MYKPVLSVINKRSEKIKEGLEKAEEADVRLKEVDGISARKLKEAENQSVLMIKDTESRAKTLESDLRKKAEDRQKALMEQVENSYKLQQEEAKSQVYKEAADLVKSAIIKTVELDPKKIDEALINKAVFEIKNQPSS